MRIAIPLVKGCLSPHFGRCEEFVLLDVNRQDKTITGRQLFPAPPHQPDLLPQWLHEQGAGLIIAAGMGPRAQELFVQHQIEVILADALGKKPDELVQSYLSGDLVPGQNLCEH